MLTECRACRNLVGVNRFGYPLPHICWNVPWREKNR